MKSFRSLSRIRYGLLTLPLCGFLALSGCASGPSGGPQLPNTANRIIVTLTLAENLESEYYYAVAFDDHAGPDSGGTGDGPIAIIGGTPIPNGIVGGNWRVAIICHKGQFEVYRRRVPTDLTTEERIDNGAVTNRLVSGKNIQFTLNLDYTGSFGRLLPLQPDPADATKLIAPQRFDVNFVTTTSKSIDNGSSRVKPVDSYGFAQMSTPIPNVQLSGTTTYNTSSGETSGDPNNFTERPDNFNFSRIDVTLLTLAANRTDVP